MINCQCHDPMMPRLDEADMTFKFIVNFNNNSWSTQVFSKPILTDDKSGI